MIAPRECAAGCERPAFEDGPLCRECFEEAEQAEELEAKAEEAERARIAAEEGAIGVREWCLHEPACLSFAVHGSRLASFELHGGTVDRMPPVVIACTCGRPLADAVSEGVWSMAGIACEYRLCACGSHRAWMPIDVLEGEECSTYNDPETSEVAASHDSLLEALDSWPANEHAQIIRRGVVLARAFKWAKLGGTDLFGWKIEAPTDERPINPAFFKKVST